MAIRLKDEYFTIPEAAEKLGVAESTIRRWIREKRLLAYRLGDRRVLLKRDDLEGLIEPVRPAPVRLRKLETVDITDPAELERLRNRRLTPEERERGLAALERLRELERELRRTHPDTQFGSVDELIREAKEQRDRRPDFE